ncbi:glycosyltransferase [Pseudophaeobacter sp.]|uniref:glycosyltransferase n=1 Tax=Pseudophaeobacter sp. TaxID=1971739 RepID=UPI003299BD4B
MRVLYYNWVDYLDDENRGGGVSQYQRNILNELDQQEQVEAVFLSAGISYDLKIAPPRWEKIRHGPSRDRNRRYEIVNSAVLSPAHFSFGSAAQIDDAATQDCFFDFIAKTGPYDVVHFNNLEGLPARVLALKLRWPNIRVVLSLHNYYPFCPQVNLWFQERETCIDFKGGTRCAACLPHAHNQKQLRLAQALAYRLKAAGVHPKSLMFKLLFQTSVRVGRRLTMGLKSLRNLWGGAKSQHPEAVEGRSSRQNPFQTRRAEMVSLINEHCDEVLAVSDFTAGIARGFGLRSDLLQTSYIGTAHAAFYETTSPRDLPSQEDQVITLGYLGYMRRDKGFFFLLKALKALPSPLAKRIRLVVAAGRGDAATMAELTALGKQLAGMDYYDGYTHDNLPQILSQIDLGIIPVLWNDNLPQVAIEMHANHIPLLTSDLGGAQELSNCADMVFRAGDIASFQARLQAVLAGEIDMESYWAGARAPSSMAEHLAVLSHVYAAPAETVPRAAQS